MDSLTASVIAQSVASTVVGLDIEVSRPAPIRTAGPQQLSFANNLKNVMPELVNALERGAVVFVPPSGISLGPRNGALIPVSNPRAAFACAVTRFFVPSRIPGIASSAIIDPTAKVHLDATVGEFSVLRAGAVVGAGVDIRDHVVVGAEVHIGEGSVIKSHAVIGEEGFGIEKDADGNNFPVPQIGSVRIGKYVQIGNFTTVCSGAIEPTVIDDYAKLSDHVHVAHNCRVQSNAILTAGVVLSGSVKVGARAWLGPGTTVRDGITIGDDAFIGIGSNVIRSVPAGQTWAGNPARSLP